MPEPACGCPRSSLAAGMLVLSACGGGDGSESGEGPIVVGAFAGLSGAVALTSNELAAGWELAFDEINAEGGIDGREIKLVVKDDSYDPAKGVAAVRELVEKEGATVITGLGTATVQAVHSYVTSKKIPILFPIAASEALYEGPTGYAFLAQPTYGSQAYLAAKYSIEERGSSKIGIITLDSESGVDVADGCKQAAADFGAEVVGTILAQPTSTSFSGSLARLRAAGADAICNGSSLESTGIQMREAEDMGWSPDWFGYVTQANSQLASLGGEQAQRFIATTPLLPGGEDDPDVEAFRDALEEAFPDVDAGYYSAFGYWAGHLIADALKDAGKDASGEEIRSAVLAWNEHESPVGLSGPLTYSEESPNGLHAAYVAELNGEQFRVVAGPTDPDFG